MAGRKGRRELEKQVSKVLSSSDTWVVIHAEDEGVHAKMLNEGSMRALFELLKRQPELYKTLVEYVGTGSDFYEWHKKKGYTDLKRDDLEEYFKEKTEKV